jgi:hypothetical protein
MSTVAQAIQLSNTGNIALSITSVSITGTNAADFAMTSNTCTLWGLWLVIRIQRFDEPD